MYEFVNLLRMLAVAFLLRLQLNQRLGFASGYLAHIGLEYLQSAFAGFYEELTRGIMEDRRSIELDPHDLVNFGAQWQGHQ